MILHTALGNTPTTRSRHFRYLFRCGAITLAGNRKLKIYGTLRCRSGRNMLVQNRVFFADEADALAKGYRPCGHCLKAAYQAWKNKTR
ncbi:Ada metal-binding domain-containing protein [Taibaiella chishuiensis]|uniref:Metal binding Ada-like protein n=1 Tax=Taibaiella chishuiensis TaxID=1434707 RepID=A0A2P8D5N0_9BACT|nr:Ada metal-binding domain-containing protein [Taibaiella chishuiensis]PSK92508.1 metal binding Ada-like protein [Taibaiella chishuiensis]